jgi:hypothetical protein
VVDPPVPYAVSCSVRVSQHLHQVAEDRGDGEAFRAALREFVRRLQIYPQFGDPLRDLFQEDGQIWVGIVPPLSMRYALYEGRRLVSIVALPVLLPDLE